MQVNGQDEMRRPEKTKAISADIIEAVRHTHTNTHAHTYIHIHTHNGLP